MMPWFKQENRLTLESANGSLFNRSGTIEVKEVQLEVPNTKARKQKIIDLVTNVAFL